MLPLFANPAGLWALLGVPVVLAIHFLQQRSRQLVTSTWFLLEPLAPESRGGRTWEKLRSSRQLWLQLLAVILAAWVLSEPRWVRGGSTQTVAVVLDSSASMAAFREPAAKAVASLFEARAGRAERTEWLVLTSDPRQPPLYRGPDRVAALAAVAVWQPALGTHDFLPALRLAHDLAGANGLTWFVTDSRNKVPAAQPAIGVGRALDNAGFAGASVRREDGAPAWRALVQNHTDRPQTRSWWIETGGARSPERSLTLAPGGLLEISGRFPDGVDRCTVVLATDDFATDDRLPLVRPAAKPLPVSIELSGETGKFVQRVIGSVEGVHFTPGEPPRLRVLALKPQVARPAGAAIFFAAPDAEAAPASGLRTPVLAERHPLLGDLNWAAFLGAGPLRLTRATSDQVLLWQGERPLVWLSGPPEARQLTLNFDWETSNAARLAAPVLLLRRQVEAVRDAQSGAIAGNFDALAPITLAPQDLAAPGPVTLEFEPAAGGTKPAATTLAPGALAALRAPAQPGFFVLRRGEAVLVRGATGFADARQADFRAAETFVTGTPPEAEALFLRNTQSDPLVPLWLGLLGLCLLGSWWPLRRTGEAELIPGTSARPTP